MGRSKDGVNLSDDKIGDLVRSWISGPRPNPRLTLTLTPT